MMPVIRLYMPIQIKKQTHIVDGVTLYLLYTVYRCAFICMCKRTIMYTSWISVCNISLLCILPFCTSSTAGTIVEEAGNDIILFFFFLMISPFPFCLTRDKFCSCASDLSVMHRHTLLSVIKSQPGESDNRVVHILCLWVCSAVNLLYSPSSARLFSIFHSSSFPRTPQSARVSSHLFCPAPC